MTIKQVCAEGGVSRNMAGPLYTLYLREGEVVGEDGGAAVRLFVSLLWCLGDYAEEQFK